VPVQRADPNIRVLRDLLQRHRFLPGGERGAGSLEQPRAIALGVSAQPLG
jgi:hypothetical protein